MASLRQDEDLWQQLVQASQTSEGAMQVDQVTNQMLALRAQQEAKSQQLMVMHYRAVALEQARRLAEKKSPCHAGPVSGQWPKLHAHSDHDKLEE